MESSAYGNAKVSFSLEEPEERPPLEFTASAEDAAGSPWSFDRLLGTLSFEAFCSTYWGKYPVLVRGRNPKLFSSLTSLGDIESYLSLPGVLDDHVFLRSHDSPRRQKFKSITEMYSEMRAGASIHLPDLEQFLAPDSPIRHLYNNTAERLQHPGHSIHCFITPPRCECLGSHYDENEIFTLQISGSKRWRFFHRVAAVEPAGCATDQPLADFSLGPGDMLYHPRGQVHEVMSEDSVSCSVAIVIRPLTWRELLSLIADDLGSTREFMEQLPAGLSWTNGASTQLAAAMESRLRIIAGKLPAFTAQDLVEKIGDDFVKGSPPPPRSQLEGLLQTGEVTLRTQVQIQSNLAYRIAPRGEKMLLLLAGGDTVKLPLKLQPVVADLMPRKGIFPVADLHPRLTDSSKVILAKKLIENGVLTVVGHSD